MNEFIEERARLVRSLADKADPFTKTRLLKLAERYEDKLAKPSRATREIKLGISFSQSQSSER